ncbi:MAG TPA: FtsX-like permease family protein, partial [Symbiobacteriaceae bacterium]|nr:FtsX-like permease family protein [Symbiobacteriaceae bacterium]
VELISLLPLIPTTSLTVANLSRESVTRSPGGSLLRAVTELLLLAVLVYETVQLLAAGSISSTLFLALPALFLVGVGLVVWRGVELVAYLADRMAGDRLSPAGYLVLSLLRHRSGRYRMLWLMLVVTMGLGIYGAKFARTLDTDLVATSQYHLGSDLRLRTYWEAEILKANASGKAQSVIYHEPPYSTYQNLPGAAATAKVQLRTGVSLFAGAKLLGNVDFQGIDPQEFGRTALFLPGLPPSPEADLKAMAADESAVLVAQSLADRLGIKPGDTLTAKTDLGEASFTVARIVANWPGRLPGDGEFVVASLSYLQNNLGLEPYDVWVRLKPGADVTQLLQELHDRQALVVDLSGLAVTVADGRREPLRLGMYGMLSAGFVVAVLVMALSYLLNVGTILRSRTKELGVLRAMGMSQRQVAWSLYGEQLLLLGTATATGLAVGGWAGSLYVPVLRVQPGQQLLPIPAASAAAEQFVLLLGGLAVLGMGMQTVSVWMRRLAIGKALRLGEDG